MRHEVNVPGVLFFLNVAHRFVNDGRIFRSRFRRVNAGERRRPRIVFIRVKSGS
jgi:hypothetical protein